MHITCTNKAPLVAGNENATVSEHLGLLPSIVQGQEVQC